MNGNETRDWREETRFLDGLVGRGLAVAVVYPRGVASRRTKISARGYRYTDPLGGVEENLAYNAFLVGKTLIGMRVTDVLAAVAKIRERSQPAASSCVHDVRQRTWRVSRRAWNRPSIWSRPRK